MLYLLRRRLGVTITEAQTIPWWHLKVYVDGLAEETESDGGDDGEGFDVVDPFGGM